MLHTIAIATVAVLSVPSVCAFAVFGQHKRGQERDRVMHRALKEQAEGRLARLIPAAHGSGS